jgi:transposase
MSKVSFHLAPVVDHLLNELKSSSKLFMDETRCPVLDPPSRGLQANPCQAVGRGKTKTGYLWAIARDERPFGGTAPPGVVFCYAPSRACYACPARQWVGVAANMQQSF